MARQSRWKTKEEEEQNPFANQIEANKYTDQQIKSSVVGNYHYESLTNEAKKTLLAEGATFKVKDTEENEYFDGPSLFWKIANIVESDNASSIETMRELLKSLNIKDYNYSVKSTMTEFKLLRT